MGAGALEIRVLVGGWERLEPVPGSSLSYLMWDVMAEWRRRGHLVTELRGVPTGGPCVEPRGVCVLHIDLTRTPADCAAYAASHAVSVNGRFLDNSKRAVSRHLVSPDDGYDGAVIVKSDLNYGGSPEENMARRVGGWRARLAGSVRRRRPWAMRSTISVMDYRVFDRRSEVPAAVWRNPGLVVERFRPEHRDGLFWVRSWLFLGDRGYVRSIGSSHPVIKAERVTSQRLGDQDDPEVLPQSVRDRRAEMGLDYGKIDFTVGEDGEAVVFDMNRTPNSAKKEPEEKRLQTEMLADGLAGLISGARGGSRAPGVTVAGAGG